MAISFRKLAIEATMELADEAKAERGQAIVRFWYIFLVTVYVLLRGAGIGPTDLPADVVRIMLTYYVGFTIFSLLDDSAVARSLSDTQSNHDAG